MEYRHAAAADHGALDAVLVSAPGRPTLPVRLTLELFGRALVHTGGGPVTVWDPCCGAGGTLAVLGLCRGDALSGLVGTDVDPVPLGLARRNLALLDDGGLDARAAELDSLARQHGKPGYADAAESARRLAVGRSAVRGSPSDRLTSGNHADGRPDGPATAPVPGAPASARTTAGPPIPYEVGVADATDPAAVRSVAARHHPAIVLADLPHGRQTAWSGDDAAMELVATLGAVLDPVAVIAVVGLGRRLALPSGTRALERLRVGHRAAALVRAGDVATIRPLSG